MKDPVPFGRFERAILGVVGGMLAILWFAGEKASGVQLLAQSNPTVPISGGWALIIVILAIVFFNAMFTAAETAVDLLTTLHVKHAADERTTLRLQSLLDHQQRFVAACSLGSQVARLALIFVGLLLAQDLAIMINGIEALSFSRILMTALLVAIPIVLINLIVGELVPKSFASIHVTSVASRLYGFARITSLVFSIPAGMVVSLANLLTARFGGRATMGMANQAEEQIKSLVETAQESGEIEVDEKELLHSVFEFTDTVVREVMTPRVDLEAMPITSKAEDVAKVIEETGHSRIPIYEETDDQIVGLIHAKDLLLSMVEARHVDLRSLMRPPLFIPENMNLQEALTEMRLNRSQLAIVQDEFGGTAGIVTTEDIVEELVGDIIDEYDEEEPAVVKTDTGFIFDGKTHVDDVNEELGADFESDEFDTVGGFVFGLFGRQPKEGESISCDGYLFKVAETDGRRILKIEIEPVQGGGPVDCD